ncbi:antibiotic biosynthesis monooxygenase [Enterobacterales bacterium CwR94]|nr:antibiotic biosynthesis monooxygenase [Enterobacterales bacterium CwR94]
MRYNKIFIVCCAFVLFPLFANATTVESQLPKENVAMSNTDYQQRFAKTPAPPYYAVMFTIQTSGKETDALAKADARMMELASSTPGYLGAEGLEDEKGFIILMSYWKDLDAIRAFRNNEEHKIIQQLGKETWFQKHTIRIAQVIREYGDEMPSQTQH